MPDPTTQRKKFDIGLSYAKEDSQTASRLVGLLENQGVSVFYDQVFKAELWGTDLTGILPKAFNDCTFCIILISSHYISKKWTNFERQHILSRFATDTSEFLLPLRLDDSVLPGLPPSIASLDLRSSSIQQIVEYILRKLDPQKTFSQTSRGKEPAHNQSELDIGVGLFSGGHFPEAAKKLRQAVELDPNDSEARYYLVLSALKDKRPKLLPSGTIKKIENHLYAAIRRHNADKYRFALALLKHDYYILNNLDPGTPSIEDLLTPAPRLTSIELNELSMCLSIPENAIWELAYREDRERD